MRIAITGAEGMLAQALREVLSARGHEVLAWEMADLDVTDADAVRRMVRRGAPEVVIQGAAYTRVDDAESDPATAMRVNAEGAENVAAACAEAGALFVYPSTDYVFSGTGTRPYRPDDPTGPVGAYARSKRAGEEASQRHGDSLVVRTSWLYGEGGPNFVQTITRLGRERDRLEVVDDQFGRPTWTVSLAETILGLVEAGATGVFHATDGGEPVSWYGFAREILALQAIATPVVPVTTDRFPRPAPRPAYSVLDCSRTEAVLGRELPAWRETLRLHLERSSPGE